MSCESPVWAFRRCQGDGRFDKSQPWTDGIGFVDGERTLEPLVNFVFVDITKSLERILISLNPARISPVEIRWE